MSKRSKLLQELKDLSPSFYPRPGTLENCTYLDLGRENLTAVPLGVFVLPRLIALRLRDNLLSSIPREISLLTNLTRLNVSENQLSELSRHVMSLTNLAYLNIHSNPINVLPPQITALQNLNYLWIHDAYGVVRIKEAPRGVTNLPCWNNSSDKYGDLSIADALRKLQLYDPEDSFLDPKWTPNRAYLQIQSLDFSRKNITKLPDDISLLTDLNYLGASHMKMTQFPSLICKMKLIEAIDISNNQIFDLPEELTLMTKLTNLNISHNLFNQFPACIFEMTHMINIDMSDNQVLYIPENFVNLTKLKYLNVSRNKIENIPPFLASIRSLRGGLMIDGNRISNIPENVIKKGCEATFDFLTASIHGSMQWTQGRLLLLGEAETGKTTLAQSIMQTSFFFRSTVDQDRKRTDGIVQLDIGMSVISKPLQEKLTLKIWDFGGQEEFQVTHPLFLSSGALVLILYRLDQCVAKNNIKRWIKMLDDFAPSSKIIIAGTHQDCKERKLYKEDMSAEIARIVNANYTIQIEKRHVFINTEIRISNKTGKRISDLKRIIYEGMCKLDSMNKSVPRTYFRLQEYLDSKGHLVKYEKIQDIYAFAERHLELDKSQLENALTFLHDLGSIVWHFSIDSAKGIVFLDPIFLIDIFRCIFSFESVYKGSNGIVLLARLKQSIIDKLNVQIHDEMFSIIISIFDHFGLGIRFNKECIAFPSLMKGCQKIEVFWNENPEIDCISETSVTINCDGEIQLSDKSNIIVQALRWTKDALVGSAHENHFYKDVAFIHLKAMYEMESTEVKVLPGSEYIVLIKINFDNIAIKIRKFDGSEDEGANTVRIFDVLIFFIRRISSIRPNLIQSCRLECTECRLNEMNGHIMTSKEVTDKELEMCSENHRLNSRIVKQGRVYMEQGISRRSFTGIKKEFLRVVDETVDWSRIDDELREQLIHEKVELVDYIGRGTYGRVYRTKYKGRDAVVKIQTLKKRNDQTINEMLDSIIFESKCIYECNGNENIVALFGVYHKDDDFYMIMENAGISLKDLMERNQKSEDTKRILLYTRQICKGLIFMHSNCLYHEDLKADNIMVLKEKVKIVDFGIVSRRSGKKVGSNLPTRFGEDKKNGSMHWQAPEIHQVACKLHYEDEFLYEEGTNVGHRGEPSNVYAVGMLVWFMFSGLGPFKNEAHPEGLVAGGLRPDIPAHAPKEFSHLIRATWRQNYKLRPSLLHVTKYLELLSLSNEFHLPEATMNEYLPIKHTPLIDMYRGEFVEWLRDIGSPSLSEKVAQETWACFAEVKESFHQRSMLSKYHISTFDKNMIVQLCSINVNEGDARTPKKMVRELSHYKLVDYLKKKPDKLSDKYLEKIKVLKLTGDIISKLDREEVYNKYSVPEQDIFLVSQCISEQMLWDEVELIL